MIPDEPVRGRTPPPWVGALSGIERCRAYSRSLLPARSGAVKQAGCKPVRSLQLREHPSRLISRKNHRHPHGALGANQSVQPWQVDFQRFTVKKQDR